MGFCGIVSTRVGAIQVESTAIANHACTAEQVVQVPVRNEDC
jgi:hypothetical protein